MVSADFFRDTNFSGRRAEVRFPLGSTFMPQNKGLLSAARLNDQISSFRISANGNERNDTSLLLFQHPDFQGRYLAFNVNPNSANEEADLRRRNFNDIISSVLLVRRHPNEFSVPVNLSEQTRNFLDGLIPGILAEAENNRFVRRARLNRPSHISWDSFPEFSPTVQHLLVDISFEIDTTIRLLRKRDFRVRFWIRFLPGDTGGIQSRIVRFIVNADRGVLRRVHLERFFQEFLLNRMAGLNTALQAAVDVNIAPLRRDGARIVDTYLLPAVSTFDSATRNTFWQGEVKDNDIFLYVGLDREVRL